MGAAWRAEQSRESFTEPASYVPRLVEDALNHDLGVARPIEDHVLPDDVTAEADGEIGSILANAGELGQATQRRIEGSGVASPLSRSPGFAGVLQDFSQIGFCLWGETKPKA